jgi:hypothetical protein
MSKKLTKEQLIELAKTRNHILISTDFEKQYKGVHSKLTFRCLTCSTEWETKVHSYKNAKKTGCPGCKKITTSHTHKGKTVSDKTRALIGKKASARPGSLLGVMGERHPRYKGGYGRDLKKRSTVDYIWINAVKKLYRKACVLTGVKINLVCHHLDGWNITPDRRYDISNGVCIVKSLHKEFHDIYGYGNNTEAQFAEYCKIKHNIDWYALKESYGNHQPS